MAYLKQEDICKEIIMLEKDTLLLRYPAFAEALLKLNTDYHAEITGTDGFSMYYNAAHILDLFRNGVTEEIEMMILHLLLHCIYGHMYVPASINQRIWNISCDISAFNIVSSMIYTDSSVIAALDLELKGFRRNIRPFTAEKIYGFLRNCPDSDKIDKLEQLFCIDDHSKWYQLSEVCQRQQLEETMTDWKKTALHTVNRLGRDGIGTIPGFEEKTHSVQHFEKKDYSAVLRSFLRRAESSTVSDELEKNIYKHGLDLYGNVLLIEPEEEGSYQKFGNVVLAFDTSGSVWNSELQKYFEQAYGILSSMSHSRFSVDIYMIDSAIQYYQKLKISSQADLRKAFHSLRAKGGGGTDFIPLFEHLEEQKKNNLDIKGCLLFTDGYGSFPSKRPSFKVMCITEGNAHEHIPSWASVVDIDTMRLEREDR